MALLAEELVEEWLNRQGYFTIRGVRIGVDEIDLLATRVGSSGEIDCRHIEVQASIRPVSYISRIPKSHLQPGQTSTSAKIRPPEMLQAGVKEWVHKKFRKKRKVELINELFQRQWTSELVVNNVKYEHELSLIESEGIEITRLQEVIRDLNDKSFAIQSASGADFADLISIAFRAKMRRDQ